jgi:hypothetical protein
MPDPSQHLDTLLQRPAPLLALAPMQEVTDGAFWTLVHQYGGADVYWTEYFRVHSTSTPERKILDAINNNTTGRPVGGRADDRQRHPGTGPHREGPSGASRRDDRFQSWLSGADRLSEVRRWRPAAGAASASPHRTSSMGCCRSLRSTRSMR